MAQAVRKEQPEGAGKNVQMGLNVEELIGTSVEELKESLRLISVYDIA